MCFECVLDERHYNSIEIKKMKHFPIAKDQSNRRELSKPMKQCGMKTKKETYVYFIVKKAWERGT